MPSRPRLPERRRDAIVWFAYPKGSSKKYKSQINRDNGWNVLGREGFEPVRMVAIDEDWSAVRFRRAGFIKNMTRDKEHLLSERVKKAGGQKTLGAIPAKLENVTGQQNRMARPTI